VAIAALGITAYAQGPEEAGRSIGKVSTQGNLIVMTLNEGAIPKANLFDLDQRTLRFTPDGAGYRIENLPLRWDAEFGAEITAAQVTLAKFKFPYSGQTWDAFTVGRTGTITFGTAAAPAGGPGRFGPAGFTIGRFDQLREAAGRLVNTQPAISVFMKPRTSGPRYVKELADRVLVTWNLTEAYGGIQDFSWTPTTNRFQATLHADGSIEMSYHQVNARDAIIGVYPMVAGGREQTLAALDDPEDSGAAAHLDLRRVKLFAIDGLFLKVTIETRGPAPPEGDAGVTGIAYRISLGPSVVWTIRGVAAGRGGGGRTRYIAAGPGVSPGVKIEGNTISVQGLAPIALRGQARIAVFAEATSAGAVADQVNPRPVSLAGVRNPQVDLSAAKKQDGPFAIAFEAFHYTALPGARDMTCTVLKALGDKFDFLIYYSDFRVDNQEAGTPSTGPLGGNVTGIGHPPGRPEAYCSAGRFQWQYAQPVYIGSNQGQERSPEGVTVDRAGGPVDRYWMAMSQVGHELGHRWSAFVSALVNGQRIPLGPTHWARGLHAPSPFPYRRPTEASAMGGGVWQDNFDGAFTQLDDDYYVPATGWSYLDLYLMGLLAPSEVPDFFLLQNLAPAGRDENGRPVFKANRLKVTIKDVIAAEGPRSPSWEKAQKNFNTGFVVIVPPGATPSKELLERTNAIRETWMDYWSVTTGRRATMTTSPR
jgi:hypothetical protein